MTDLSYIEGRVLDFCNDGDVNVLISSEKYFDGPCMLGIDEAGRGPVLGPMVYAGAYIELNRESRLKSIGIDDSKKLSESTRDNLLAILSKEKICGYEIEIISPHVISTQMLNTVKTSLNVISHNAAIDIIRRVLDNGVNLQEVYIDTVGPADKYKALIESHFPTLKVTVEPKADSKFPIVSAASIFAKVTRDKCIVNWKHKENIKTASADDCGSGYPSDPVTKRYLTTLFDQVFGFPHFVRASWSTAAVIVDKECIKVQWEDDDINESRFTKPGKRNHGTLKENSNQSLLNFYSPEVSVEKRNKFFTSRRLERVQSLM